MTEKLYRNDGTGWRVIYSQETSGVPPVVTGYPDGRVVLATADACPVMLVQPDGTSVCLWSDAPFQTAAARVSATGELFLIGSYESKDLPSTWVLLKYDGSTWVHLAMPQGALSLGVGDSTLLLGGANQAWTGDPGGNFVPLPAVPAGVYRQAWVYSPTSIVMGNMAAQMVHYDGSAWTSADTNFNDEIYGIWGAPDGAVFAFAQAAFGYWKNGAFTSLFSSGTDINLWPTHYFVSMWGNSSTEVFLALNDGAFLSGYACGTTFLLWWDGATFHEF